MRGNKIQTFEKNSEELAFAQFFRVYKVQSTRLSNCVIKINQWLPHEPIGEYRVRHHTE